MKKRYVIICLTIFLGGFIHTELSGQTQKDNFNLSVRVGAQKLTSSSGGITNFTNTQEKSFSVYPSIDYYYNDRLFSGLEFGFTHQNKEILNTLFTPHYYQEAFTETDVNMFQFTLRNGYELLINERLYFQVIAGLNYAYITQHMKYSAIGGNLLVPGIPSIINTVSLETSEDEFKQQSDYTSITLNPQITFFITQSIGINLSLGGLEYGFYNWDIENDLWILSFKTNLWRLGVNFSF